MKVKKLIILLSAIFIIAILSVNVWATNNKENQNLMDILNKVDSEEEQSSYKNENDILSEILNNENNLDEKNQNKDEKIEKNETSSYEIEIYEDIARMEPADNIIEYKSSYIDGNVFIVTGNRITIKDSKINGDVFLVSQSVELENVEVNGSVYIVSADIVIDATTSSMYLTGKNIVVSSDNIIEKEFRAVGENVKLSGNVGRDVYVDSNNFELDENTNISGKCVINTQNVSISDKAIIKGELDVTKIERTDNQITVASKLQIWDSFVEFIIILIISIIILCFFPKFKKVNSRLRLRDFIKSFFLGIFEFVISFIIVIALLVLGYGAGYGIALFGLTLILLGLGKLIFVLAFAIRICSKKKEPTNRKAICVTVIVTLIVQALELISLNGMTGVIIVMIINMIMGITGFGSLLKVVFVRNIEALNKSKEDSSKDNKEEKNLNNNTELENLKEEVKREIDEEKREIEKIKKEIKNEENDIKEVKEKTEKESKEVKMEINDEKNKEL